MQTLSELFNTYDTGKYTSSPSGLTYEFTVGKIKYTAHMHPDGDVMFAATRAENDVVFRLTKTGNSAAVLSHVIRFVQTGVKKFKLNRVKFDADAYHLPIYKAIARRMGWKVKRNPSASSFYVAYKPRGTDNVTVRKTMKAKMSNQPSLFSESLSESSIHQEDDSVTLVWDDGTKEQGRISKSMNNGNRLILTTYDYKIVSYTDDEGKTRKKRKDKWYEVTLVNKGAKWEDEDNPGHTAKLINISHNARLKTKTPPPYALVNNQHRAIHGFFISKKAANAARKAAAAASGVRIDQVIVVPTTNVKKQRVNPWLAYASWPMISNNKFARNNHPLANVHKSQPRTSNSTGSADVDNAAVLNKVLLKLKPSKRKYTTRMGVAWDFGSDRINDIINALKPLGFRVRTVGTSRRISYILTNDDMSITIAYKNNDAEVMVHLKESQLEQDIARFLSEFTASGSVGGFAGSGDGAPAVDPVQLARKRKLKRLMARREIPGEKTRA